MDRRMTSSTYIIRLASWNTSGVKTHLVGVEGNAIGVQED